MLKHDKESKLEILQNLKSTNAVYYRYYLEEDVLKAMEEYADKMNGTISEYQLCPKCNGEGKMLIQRDFISTTPFPYSTSTSSAPFMPCDVCNGVKILIKPIVK